MILFKLSADPEGDLPFTWRNYIYQWKVKGLGLSLPPDPHVVNRKL